MNNINLSKVNLQAPTQLRMMEDQTHIEDLAHAYADNGSFHELPWVALVKETKEYVPIDGFHRLMAVEWLHNQSDIQTDANTEVVAIRYSEFDTLAEAIVAAAGVNSTHGLKRKRGDIANAIQSILKVDRIRFMESKFKLNKKAIMEVVNCSARTYEIETKKLRNQLEAARNDAIEELAEEGLSLRDIAQRISVSPQTVNNILGVQKAQDAENGQPEVTPEETTEDTQEPSVFNHITTATVAECPWAEYEQEEEVATDPSEVASEGLTTVKRKATMSDHDLALLLDKLTDRQRDFARNYLSGSNTKDANPATA